LKLQGKIQDAGLAVRTGGGAEGKVCRVVPKKGLKRIPQLLGDLNSVTFATNGIARRRRGAPLKAPSSAIIRPSLRSHLGNVS